MSKVAPNGLRVVSQPLQWACDAVPCECTLTKTITLDDNAVWVTVTLDNHRQDTTDYGKFDQEFPAAYFTGILSTLTCYVGDAPWTGGKLTEWPDASGPPWKPGHINCSEHWAAFVDPATQFSAAVFRPDWPVFLTGFHGTHGSGGPTDDATGYIAGGGCGGVDIKHDTTLTYTFALVIGNLPDVRAYVQQFRHQVNDTCMGYAAVGASVDGEDVTPLPLRAM